MPNPGPDMFLLPYGLTLEDMGAAIEMTRKQDPKRPDFLKMELKFRREELRHVRRACQKKAGRILVLKSRVRSLEDQVQIMLSKQIELEQLLEIRNRYIRGERPMGSLQ